MNPDSFRGKILLSIADKLIFGLAAIIVVLIIQKSHRQDELVNQERIAVAGVVTSVLSDQQTRLMANVSNFLGLVDRLKAVGSARDADAVRLRDLEQAIRGSVAVLKTIHFVRPQDETCEPRDDSVLDEFNDSIKGLTVPLMSSTLPPESTQKQLDVVRSKYTRVLKFMRCLIVQTIHDEIAHSHD